MLPICSAPRSFTKYVRNTRLRNAQSLSRTNAMPLSDAKVAVEGVRQRAPALLPRSQFTFILEKPHPLSASVDVRIAP